MSNTVEYFMWGYQQHFKIMAQTAAESLFSKLDRKLNPHIFLVGVLTEERKDRHPICIEPEDCQYKPKQFADILEQAKHWEAVSIENHIIHSHPVAQERSQRRHKIGSLKQAIEQIVNLWGNYRGLISFLSWPMLIEGYMVSVVLQFDRAAFDAHYSLTKGVIEGRYAISTSLLDAVIGEYLKDCSKALDRSEPGSEFGIFERESDEVLRTAGKSLMYSASAPASITGGYSLFDVCNTISSMRYEGAEGVGRMLIAKRGHPNVKPILAFLSPVMMNNYRAVRKLLEVSSNGYSLLCDAETIYGLGEVAEAYDYRREDLFSVKFTSYYTWELEHAGHIMMEVSYRQPGLRKKRVDKEKFESDLKRIFHGITARSIEKLWAVITEAIKQKHGTMIVVLSEASTEATRLANQCIRIEPVEIESEIVRAATSIDGAIMLDETATCYAIGVILDGLASNKGDSARGARYNSAIRYIESKDKCLAIVISEDGMIDLIPNLMPQISRSAIKSALSKLQSLKSVEPIDVKEFNKVMGWLSRARFYLSAEVCDEVNNLRREIEARFEKNTTVRILYDDLIPNDEMNESYFSEE